jgi:methionyl aminopeptidase
MRKKNSNAILVKSPEQVELSRIAGQLASRVLDMIGPHVQPGVSTEQLDQICTRPTSATTASQDPVHLGQRRGLPRHPSEKDVLKDGDIINIDVTVIKDGWHGDTSRMYFAGTPSPEAKRLVDVTFDAMMAGIRTVRPGARLGDVGHAIQKLAEKAPATRWCANTAATASAASTTKTRRCCTTAARTPACC